MREINEKIKQAKTNSDLKDIANEYGVSVHDVIHLHNIMRTDGTKRAGSKYNKKGF